MKFDMRRVGFAGIAIVAAAVVFSLFPSRQALSLTGKDVVDKMSADESGGYIAGSIEMAAFLSHAQGNRDRSTCITNWYYKKNGVEQTVAALSRYKSREAQPVLYAMIEQVCGK